MALAIVLFSGAASAAEKDEPRYAAMVLDANTGKVLYEASADEPRYPASLTKMMTLYLVFEELKAGRLSYKSRITMSAAAASVAPSKLGLDPGDDIAVLDGIKALITKSANDIAVSFAENIAGSEDAFARRMTSRARAIGMSRTTFRNASGLPDPEQVTTARDMLTLALRLYDDYPDEFRLFALRSFTYKGKTYRTHNTLMNSFEGMDGIKTGYTRASGFNLVTSVRNNGIHLVGAVFGGSTAASRNSQMRFLLRRAMVDASKEKTRVAKPVLVAATAPAARPAARPEQQRDAPAAAPAPPKKVAPEAAKAEPRSAPQPVPDKVAPAPAASPPPAPPPAAAAQPEDQPIQIVSVRPVPLDILTGRTRAAPAAQPAATQPAAMPPAAPPAVVGDATPRLDFVGLKQAATAYANTKPKAPPPTAPPAATETVAAKIDRSLPAPGRTPSTLNDQLALLIDATSDVPPPSLAQRSAPAPATASTARPPSTLQQQVLMLQQQQPASDRAWEPAWRLRGPTSDGLITTEIEVGVFATAEDAERQIENAKAAAPRLATETGLALPVKSGKRLAYGARFTGLTEPAAQSVCDELRRRAFQCRIASSQ